MKRLQLLFVMLLYFIPQDVFAAYSPCDSIVASATAGTIACHGGSTTVTVTGTGGVGPLSGIGTFEVTAGTYTYYVTDVCGVWDTVTVTVTEPPFLNAFMSWAPILCPEGTAVTEVTALGGTPPYSGTGNYTVTAGTPTVIVTDANGCTATASMTFTEPAPFIASASAGTIACHGATTSVTVTATGGTYPLSGDGIFTVPAGSYTYTVTNAHGCTATTSITVNEPDLLEAHVDAGAIPCYGETTTVTVTATGGTTPYSGTGTFTVSAGSYTYTVTDANGCTDTKTITINEPPLLEAACVAGEVHCKPIVTVNVTSTGGTGPCTGTGVFTVTPGACNFTITDINGCTANTFIISPAATTEVELQVAVTAGTIPCFGGTTTVTVTATGGTEPYEGTGTFTASAGVHEYTVTCATGCIATATITITQPENLTVAATTTPILCNGGAAAATVAATGGTAPYNGTGTFTVSAGVQNYTVTDANGCSSSTFITVSQPDALMASATAGTIKCHGATTTVTVTATGGAEPYTGTGTFEVAFGTHEYTITDANGCSATTTIIVEDHPIFIVSAASPGIRCKGDITTITVSAINGLEPYSGIGTYSVGAGTYNYIVTDANGCIGTTTVTIGEPPLLTLSASGNNVPCHGGTTALNISAAGGSTPYTGTGTFSVTAGPYNYTTVDANGCEASISGTITEPEELVVNAAAGTILTYGGTTTVSVTATGGTPSYTGTGTFTVPAGSYTYTVTDASGCTATAMLTITQPPVHVAASATAGTINCYGGQTTVTVNATDGVPPYTGTGTFTAAAGTHTYIVTDSGNDSVTVTITVTEPSQLTALAEAGTIHCFGQSTAVQVNGSGGTAPYTNTGTFTAAAGDHTYTITDSKGCEASATITLQQPAQLTLVPSSTNAGCNGNEKGTATITAMGGTAPYTYQWAGRPADHSNVLVNLAAGVYPVTVTDNNGCSQSAQVVVNAGEIGQASVQLTYQVTHPLCNESKDGTVQVSVTGGVPPYSFMWALGETTAGLSGLGAGLYSVKVTDDAGCFATTTVELVQPTPISISLNVDVKSNGLNISGHGISDGHISSNISGGTAPYIYAWSNGGNTPDVNNLKAGDYELLVTDGNGCTASVDATLREPGLVILPTGFTPNGDGQNDFFVIPDVKDYPNNTLEIYNRWGNKVWESAAYQNNWAGTNLNNEQLPEGTYYLILTVNNGEYVQTGYVDVRR